LGANGVAQHVLILRVGGNMLDDAGPAHFPRFKNGYPNADGRARLFLAITGTPIEPIRLTASGT
jgi:uncharacterized protein involved in outer membrane biogenesis